MFIRKSSNSQVIVTLLHPPTLLLINFLEEHSTAVYPFTLVSPSMSPEPADINMKKEDDQNTLHFVSEIYRINDGMNDFT